MSDRFEVSFNSPQCGWMSIGFSDGTSEFHTTTAHTPHSQALTDILKVLSSLLEVPTERDMFVVPWSRNPEAYDLHFRREGGLIFFEVVEYPTFDRERKTAETVFSYEGDLREFCLSFYETFAQLYEDRHTDEFEFNWRQPFPLAEFEKFKSALEFLRT